MMGRLLASLVLSLAIAGPARAADLTVVTNNTENMPELGDPWKAAGCDGDWHYLPQWLASNGRTPDVMLLQQIPNLSRLKAYVAELEARFPGVKYAGTIADEQPPNRLERNECAPKNPDLGAYQSNAIIWRTDRLRALAPAGTLSAPYGPCRDNGSAPDSKTVCFQSVYASAGCRSENTQARTRNAALRFADGSRRVTIASLHWGSGNVGNQQAKPTAWNRCARENARRATRAVRTKSDLQVFGGDLNLRAEPRKSGDFNPTFDDYIRNTLRFGDVGATLGPTGTSRARRDFIFARTAAKQPVAGSNSVVVPWVAGAVHYSDHRAIVTTLSY